MKKRLLTLILLLATIVGGAQSRSHLITTQAELMAIPEGSTDTYILQDNIRINLDSSSGGGGKRVAAKGGWTPIKNFRGFFDGNGFHITFQKNATDDYITTTDDFALFDNLYGTVRLVRVNYRYGVVAPYVHSGGNFGGIALKVCDGGKIELGESGIVMGLGPNTSESPYLIGGIAAECAEGGVITDCTCTFGFSNGDWKIDDNYIVGGIVGKVTGGEVSGCTVSTRLNTVKPWVGMIAGKQEGGTVKQCIYTARGDVHAIGTATGSEDDPERNLIPLDGAKIIRTLNGLMNIPDGSTDKYVLMADIDCGDWTPKPTFKGTFNGLGHTITYKNCTPDYSYSIHGLFRVLSGATVKNLTVKGSIESKCSLTDAGGIAGKLVSESIIQNCESYINVTSGRIIKSAGGIAGSCHEGSQILNCRAYGNIDITIGTSQCAGGIAGACHEGSQILNCQAYGNIGTDSHGYGGGIVGRLFGFGEQSCTIKDCYFGGTVKKRKKYNNAMIVGGFGLNEGHDIRNCTYNRKTANGLLAIGTGAMYGDMSAQYESRNYPVNGVGPDEPIDIYTLDELKTISADESYRLMADIDCGDWTPKYFKGMFDGNGHTITYKLESRDSYRGLFSALDGALVKNLTVKGEIRAEIHPYSGGIAGSASYNSLITDCKSYVDVTLTKGASNGGGIVGYCSGSEIRNCQAYGTISTHQEKYHYAGGIVGGKYWGSIKDCYFGGKVEGNNTFVGMIIGIKHYGAPENCTYSSENANGYKAIGTSTGSEDDEANGVMADTPEDTDATEVIYSWGSLYAALSQGKSNLKLTTDLKYGQGGDDDDSKVLPAIAADKEVTINLDGYSIDGDGKVSIFDNQGTLTLTGNGLIMNGHATDKGGAIYNKGQLNIACNITFKDNTAQQGGAIYNDADGKVSASGYVNFMGNTATTSGNNIYHAGSSFVLTAGTSGTQAGDVFLADGKIIQYRSGTVDVIVGNTDIMVVTEGEMADYVSTYDVPWQFAAATAKSLTTTAGPTRIGDNAFCGFSALEEVYLPSTMQSVSSTAFVGCDKVVRLISYADSPTGLTWDSYEDSFRDEGSDMTVYVNKQYIDEWQAKFPLWNFEDKSSLNVGEEYDPYWDYEDTSTGIRTVEATTATLPDARYWYTIGGQRLSGQPTKPGLYINNGRKVVIK